MFVGGYGLARGYLNRPELTRQRFIPNPFSNKPEDRLYVTGDIARYRSNGDLEYLGRNDNQVKIRGFRIELGEIEALLAKHPDIRDNVVMVREDQPGNKRLAAYIVTDREESPASADLRQFLKDRLPEYMIPSAFVRMEALPLTPNGKTDYKSLPVPEGELQSSETYMAPTTERERKLVKIWQEVLNVERVGVNDNLFELGGDSILTIRIVSRANQEGLKITAKDILLNQTVAELAKAAKSDQIEEKSLIPLLEISPEERNDILIKADNNVEDIYPAVRMQEFMIRNYLKWSEKSAYHFQMSFDLEMEDFSLKAFREAARITVQENPIFRTYFAYVSNDQLVQIIKKDCEPIVEYDDIRNLAYEEQKDRIDGHFFQDRHELIDIYDPKQMSSRIKIFHLSDNSICFFRSQHHATIDGWSNILFLNRLFEVYHSLRQGIPVHPKKSAANSYKEFVAIEQEILSDAEASRFWEELLLNHREVSLAKKTEKISKKTEYDLHYKVEPALLTKIENIAKSDNVSMKAVYLTAYLKLISDLSNEKEVTVGVITNRRTNRLTDPLDTMGYFWNLIPFHFGMSDGEPLLKSVQSLLHEIDSYYGLYPLQQILENRQKEYLFFATFNYTHFHHAKGDEFRNWKGMKLFNKFHFPLNFVINKNPSDNRIFVAYDENYFSETDIQQIVDNYMGCLNSLC